MTYVYAFDRSIDTQAGGGGEEGAAVAAAAAAAAVEKRAKGAESPSLDKVNKTRRKKSTTIHNHLWLVV